MHIIAHMGNARADAVSDLTQWAYFAFVSMQMPLEEQDTQHFEGKLHKLMLLIGG